MLPRTSSIWQRDSHPTASGKPGAVQIAPIMMRGSTHTLVRSRQRSTSLLPCYKYLTARARRALVQTRLNVTSGGAKPCAPSIDAPPRPAHLQPKPPSNWPKAKTAEEICRFVRECDDGMVVLGRRGRQEAGRPGMGATVHKVLMQTPAPVLLVPVEAPLPAAPYRRVVVPLDGSRWAESVLPLAVRLAKASEAELLLVHVVPTPEMIEARPLEVEDKKLQQALIERNEQAARSYLDRTKSNLSASGLRMRTISIRGEDVREVLCDLIQRERADIAVLSARGHSHRHVSDVPYGTVASYLMTHCNVPMLVTPATIRSGKAQIAVGHNCLRLPLAAQA